MLDPSKLTVGSIVKLEGKLVQMDDDWYNVMFTDDTESVMLDDCWMKHAELVSQPITFTKEQVDAIKHLGVNPSDFSNWYNSLIAYLEAHTKE